MTRLFLTLALLFAVTTSVAANEKRAEFFVGGGVAFTGPNFYVTIHSDGRLKIKQTGMPIVPPGKLTEKTRTFSLTAGEAQALLELAEDADDFTEGCRTVADGTSAGLSVIDGERKSVRSCSNAAEWPVGCKTRRFMQRLKKNLPSDWEIH